MRIAERTVWQLLGYEREHAGVRVAGALKVGDEFLEFRDGGLVLSPRPEYVNDTFDHMQGMSILYRMLLVATGRRDDPWMACSLSDDQRRKVSVVLIEVAP